MKVLVIYASGEQSYRQVQIKAGQPVVERDHRTLTLRAIKPGFVYQEVEASEYHAPKPKAQHTPWWYR